MKRLVSLPLIILWAISLFGFSVSCMEYFLDADPGFGNGIPIAITPDAEVSLLMQIPLTNPALTVGMHRLFLRVKDSRGRWSLAAERSVYKYNIPQTGDLDISVMEYYWDSDPGWGNGQNLLFSSASDVSCNQLIDLDGLSDGPHTLTIRAKRADGTWSLGQQRQVFKTAEPAGDSIVRLCWSFQGAGVNPLQTYSSAVADPAADIQASITANVQHLQFNVPYQMYFWAVDNAGVESHKQLYEFRLLSPPPIQEFSSAGNTMLIRWLPVTGATGYQVRSSASPDTGFSPDASGSYDGTTWTTTMSAARKFFQVIATGE